MTLDDGENFCAQTYDAHLMVPNSRDEAVYIGNYLASLKSLLVILLQM